MKIANADKLKQHFENVVDVKLFTPAQIITIIDTFSKEVPDYDCISREEVIKSLFKGFNCEDATKYGNKDSKQQTHSYSTWMLYEISDQIEDSVESVPDIFGGTKP